MEYQRSASLALACALLLSAAQEARAQTSIAKKEEKISVLEEIVVTAQRREESLQDVPIAITAITSDTRDLLGVTTIEDLTNYVPGLTYENQLDRANIRGVGRVTNTPGSDPGVGLYVDGVYNSSTASVGRSSIFSERIEVLRGPQGSLFGRNTTGGAISVVSRKPGTSQGGELRFTVGAYDRRVYEGSLTSPITDWLRFRTTFSLTKQDDGFFRNRAPNHENEGGNADDKDSVTTLEMDLGERVDLTLRYSRQDQERLNRFNATLAQPNYTLNMATSGTFSVPTIVNFNFGARNGYQPNPLFNSAAVTPETLYTVPNPTTESDRRVFSANVPTKTVLDGADAITTNLTWHLGSADLKWIGGFVNYDYYSWSDADGTAREFYDYNPTDVVNGTRVRVYTGTRFLFEETKDYWSNELQLVSTGTGDLQWAAALYQYHEKYEQVPIATGFSNPSQVELWTVYPRPVTATVPTTLAGYAALGTTPAYLNPKGMISEQRGVIEVDTYAAMSQVTWKATDTLRTTIGGRINRDTKEGRESRFAVIWDPSILGGRAVAFDNSAVNDCYSPNEGTHSLRPEYQATVNSATGVEIPLTGTSTSYAATCRTRQFEKRTWDNWSGNVDVEWKPISDFMTYAKYSRGYKSGALRVGLFSLDGETDPEHSNNYELGLKYTFRSRYQINLSTFYVDYRELQFPVTEIVETSPGQFGTIGTYTNVEKSKTYGSELEAVLNPWSTLSLIANYAFLRTKIDSDLYIVDPNDPTAAQPDANPDNILVSGGNRAQNVRGNEWPGQPRHKAFANLTYGFKFDAGTLTPSVSYAWRGPVSAGGLTVSAFSRDRNKTPSYSNIDARLTWVDSDKRYRIVAYVANLTDNETINSLAAGSTVNGQPVQNFLLNPPRTYGLSVYTYFGSDRR